MKRLIKKAEFFTADYMDNLVDGGEKYVEIFKNPTTSEMDEVNKQSEYGIRGLMASDGTLFFWSGDILHFVAVDYIKGYNDLVHIETDMSKLTFSDIGLTEDFIKQVKAAKTNFEKCGFNENTLMEIAGYGSLGDLDNCKTLADIYNL